jgi:hypothetical protein
MKRHSTDLVSLVFGIIFLGAAGWWLAAQYVHIDVPHVGWITAAVLIGLGVLGLAGSLRSDRSSTRPTSAPTVQMAASAPVPPAPPAMGEDQTKDEDDGPRDRPSTDHF